MWLYTYTHIHLRNSLKKLELPSHSQKIIRDHNSIIYESEMQYYGNVEMVQFQSELQLMNWTLTVKIPKKLLFKEVNHMRFINLLYVFFAVCSAGVAAYYISRRLTVPINQIVDGTKEFAAGNLDYRIDLKSGCEIKKAVRCDRPDGRRPETKTERTSSGE